MKKTKRHFYQNRIKILSLGFVLLIAGALFAGAASSNDGAKSLLKALPVASIAFVPLVSIKGKLKAKGVYDNLDADTQTYIDTLDSEINQAFAEAEKGKLTVEQIEAKHKEWMKAYGQGLSAEQLKEFTDMTETIKNQAIAIQQLKDGGLAKPGQIKRLSEQMKERKDEVAKFLSKGLGKISFDMATKAGGADQAATDIATHTIGLRVPGIGQIPTRRPFLRDLFPTVNTSLEYIKYIDQETVVRDAKNVASGAASTHTSKVTWKERSIQIVNVRDLVDVPIDMLSDYDFVEGELRNMLDINVQLKVDSGLLSGTGVAPELHSIGEIASEFDATNTLGGTITPFNGTIQAPNIFDLVIAMTAQIIALGKDGSFMPNVVCFNTIDRYKALLIKDKDDNYLMPPFVTRVGGKEYNIDGMMVRSNPDVAANSVWVFDSMKGTIYQRKAAVAEISYENASNFETETATMKVYERLNLLIRNVNANAFMKCTDVSTALSILATP